MPISLQASSDETNYPGVTVVNQFAITRAVGPHKRYRPEIGPALRRNRRNQYKIKAIGLYQLITLGRRGSGVGLLLSDRGIFYRRRGAGPFFFDPGLIGRRHGFPNHHFIGDHAIALAGLSMTAL